MALDKVVDSAALDAGLTKIANAIRAKGGTDGTMQFPDEFAALIEAITSGGGGVDFAPFSDAKFGTFTIAKTGIRMVNITGLGNSKLFAMRRLATSSGSNDMTMSNIVACVLAEINTDRKNVGLFWWFDTAAFTAKVDSYSLGKSGDTLIFGNSVGYLYGTYEWVVVS